MARKALSGRPCYAGCVVAWYYPAKVLNIVNITLKATLEFSFPAPRCYP